ncbi:DNA primase catalytic subunit PriS [Candidatus Micrarchaeota archaeon]|nr:DNA primase catalytic subunit PriS [Candidatus Micrarchaeota archaeon]MBD3417926.1 DNA primase catalytic subunit PriS [Candidatus Micrarchaeota archaeon]
MEKEKVMVLSSFSDYYKGTDIEVPAVEQREFGVGGFKKKIESRHLSFKTDEALKNYLVQETPLYISHSIAYYKFPESTPMERKEWMGGDLIFDLDVHAGIFLTPEEIEQVTGDAITLAEDFLEKDFGVKKDEITMVFSGGRGFHIHVKTPRFRYLEGDGRREIADYVAGAGLDYRKFFEKIDRYRLEGPKKTDWGYRGRFCRMVGKRLDEKPSSIHRGLKKPGEKEKLLGCMEDGNWSKTPIKDIVERLEGPAKEMRLETVEVDTGVTIDTKRLIRVPDTLHGSTGLIAKKLKKVDDFEPYRDALAFGSEPIKIKAKQDLPEQEFADSTMENMKKEEEKEVPKSYGIYLILKDAATLS